MRWQMMGFDEMKLGATKIIKQLDEDDDDDDDDDDGLSFLFKQEVSNPVSAFRRTIRKEAAGATRVPWLAELQSGHGK